MRTAGVLVTLFLGGPLALAACGGGGDGSSETEITGNLAERTAWVAPARDGRPQKRGWLAGWSFVGVAHAHEGVNGVDVCAETCPVGLDSSDRCPDPQPSGFCSRTDDGGFFTVRGAMSGDLCVRFTDPDDPGFAPTLCVRGVPRGARVTVEGMSCSHGDGECSADRVEMHDRMRDRDRMG